MSKRQVYLHVGLPKSGTTYLQSVFEASRDHLRRQGVLYPGSARVDQRYAVWDLLGRRLRGVEQPHVTGAWHRLVEEVSAWSGETVLVSEEFLVHARARHVRRIARDLAGDDLHVVVTVRDLERTITSAWQQELAKARTWTLAEYVAGVRDPERNGTTAGVGFWLRFDLERVLATWSAVVPPERVHVVVVPGAGSPTGLLLERFGAAIGLDVSGLAETDQPVNTAVGATEAEVLRRLNVALGSRLNERQYNHVVDRVVRPALRTRGGPAIRLPDEVQPWVKERSERLVASLAAGPYPVVGDLEELMPHGAGAGVVPDSVEDGEVADAMVAAFAATVEQYARHWWRNRERNPGGHVPAATKISSTARALTFRAGFAALDMADRNRLASRLAARYLRRLSGRR